MRGKPCLGDANELVVKNEQVVACEDACSDLVARPGRGSGGTHYRWD